MKPILIDLDGTILDCRPRHYAVYSEILAELGREPLPVDEFWRRRREGNSTQALLADVLSEGERRQFSEQWLARVESPDALALDTLFPGAIDALARMGRGYDVVLVTLRRERDNLLGQLDDLGLSALFSEVISVGDDLVHQKHLLPGLERVADGGCVVGDTEADIEFAAETGCEVVCVANGVRDRDFLVQRGAQTIVESIVDVPGALGTGTVTRVA